MPPPAEILAAATAIATSWWLLAVAWHAALGVLLVALVRRWRPARRTIAWLAAAPLASVSLLAWQAGNPFNGGVFAAATAGLSWLAWTAAPGPVRLARPLVVVAGAYLLKFAWVYPHFLPGAHWTTYLYAAPLGLVPCPTLAAVTGLTLMLDLVRWRAWSWTVAALTFAYGVIGVFHLGVVMDVVLIGSALALLAAGGGREAAERGVDSFAAAA